MNRLVIPRRCLEAITTAATLLGLILAVLTIAESIRDQHSVAWPILGFVVAVLGAFSVADRLFGCFGRARRNDEQLQRVVGGGMTIVLFAIFVVMLGFFTFR